MPFLHYKDWDEEIYPDVEINIITKSIVREVLESHKDQMLGGKLIEQILNELNHV